MPEASVDVAIVGFGPTGATAAGLLGTAGLRVFACDRSTAIYDKPRAFSLDHEVMRVFQALGIADEVLAHAEPFTPSEFYGVDGQLIKRFTTVEPPHPLAFEPSLVFSQPELERVLRDRIARQPEVELALGWRVTAIAEDADGVRLVAEDDHGAQRAVRARYLIGCDGASSTIRGFAGITLEDLGFDQSWLVVDVLANEAGLARLPRVSMQICEPARPCTYLVGPRNHRRWEIALDEEEDATVTPERTWALLARWIGPEHGKLWRQASYRFHALVAERWRRGRVFVAGDAAHQQPPFLGQGMCQGVRDAANLAWKLAGVLEGRSDERLLDTYGEERKGHVTELTTRIKAIGELVGERDPVKARARDAALLAACDGVVKSQPRQSVQPALAAGLLSPERADAVGRLLPQPWVVTPRGRQRLDDVVGRGWRLLVDRDAVVPQACSQADLGWPLATVRIGASGLAEADGVMQRWFEANACRYAIARPDHYVWGTAATEAGLGRQLALLADQLRGEVR